MILLTGFYEDADPHRRAEHLECLRRNAANDRFDQIHLLIEEPSGLSAETAARPVFANAKVRSVAHGRRVTFRDLFAYANAHLAKRRVVIANADIYFDETLALLERFALAGRLLCLSRWDVRPDGTAALYDHSDSQDAWVFETPIHVLDCDFHLGLPGCDNRIAYQAERAGLIVTNPSRSIRAHHLHLSQLRRYNRAQRLTGPWRAVPPTFLEMPPPIAREPNLAVPSLAPGASDPLVSCIMPTYNRRAFVALALHNFLAQDYPNRELIVIDDGSDPVGNLVAGAPGVRYYQLPARVTIGEKRNLACDLAAGSLIAHWDDDDWYSPRRLSHQTEPVRAGLADITGLATGTVLLLPDGEFRTPGPALRRLFGGAHGGTLVFRREILSEAVRYPPARVGSDTAFLRAAVARGARLCKVPNGGTFVYVRHTANIWRFAAGPNDWDRAAAPDGFPPDALDRYRAAARAT